MQIKITPYTPTTFIIREEGDRCSETMTKIKRVPSIVKWEGHRPIIKLNALSINYIEANFHDVVWVHNAKSLYTSFKEMQQKAEKTREQKATDDILNQEDDFKYKRTPMDHQRKAFLISRDQPVFALLMEQGTGKTKVALDNAVWLYNTGKIDAVVIVASPNGLHRNWIEYELKEDVPLSVPHIGLTYSSGMNKKETDLFNRTIDTKNKLLKIFAFNVEAFSSNVKTKATPAMLYIDKILSTHNVMMIIDQSASIKNHSSNRTKFLMKMGVKAKYRRILDGAPVAEGAEELFSQFKFLDPQIIGHSTYTGFKAEFCRIGYFNNIEGYVNLDELHRRIDGFCYRVLEADCLELPARIYKRFNFDITGNTRKIYDQLKTKDIVEFKLHKADDEQEFTDLLMEEQLAMIKTMRLQQISSGYFADDDKGLIKLQSTPDRLAALRDLLKHIGPKQKALIFCRFIPEIRDVLEMLGDSAVGYYGGVSEKQREANKRAFKENDNIKYLVGQPRAMGVGHTFTEAKHVIFYSNDPTLRMREESEKRAHRKGQTDRLHIWDLIAVNTIDSKIVSTLRNKKELSNQILQDKDNFFLMEEYNEDNIDISLLNSN